MYIPCLYLHILFNELKLNFSVMTVVCSHAMTASSFSLSLSHKRNVPSPAAAGLAFYISGTVVVGGLRLSLTSKSSILKSHSVLFFLPNCKIVQNTEPALTQAFLLFRYPGTRKHCYNSLLFCYFVTVYFCYCCWRMS